MKGDDSMKYKHIEAAIRQAVATKARLWKEKAESNSKKKDKG